MNKILLVLTLVLGTLVSNGQSKDLKIGGMTTLTSGGVGYGTFLELNRIGIMYSRIANLSNEDPTDYIYGNVGSYTAGTDISNIGIYLTTNVSKSFNIVSGLGHQNINDITTNGIKNKQSLFALFGTEFLTNTNLSIRTDMLVSVETNTIFSIGIGYKLQ